MRYVFFIFFFVMRLTVSGQYELPQTKYPIKSINVYCIDHPDHVQFGFRYFYNYKKQLERYTRGLGNSETYYEEHNFEFDNEGRVLKETVYQVKQNERTLQSYTKLFYIDDNLMKREFYGPSNQLMRTEENIYKGKLLIRSDLTYYTDGALRLQAFEKKDYDSNRRLINASIFNGNAVLTNSIKYEYTDDLLSTITEEEMGKKRTTVIEYDSDNRVIRKLQNGNLTQENTWSGDHLLQRDEFYFGIDPCRDLCCGKNRLKIEYY